MEAAVIMVGAVFIFAASFSSSCLNPRVVRIVGALIFLAGLVGLVISQGLVGDPFFRTVLFFVFCFSVGIVFAIAFAHNVKTLRRLDTRVEATLVSLVPYKKGYSPVFSFKHGGKSYAVQTADVISSHRQSSFVVGNQFNLYICSRNPYEARLHRGPGFYDWILAICALTCFAVPIAYVLGLFNS